MTWRRSGCIWGGGESSRPSGWMVAAASAPAYDNDPDITECRRECEKNLPPTSTFFGFVKAHQAIENKQQTTHNNSQNNSVKST